MVKKISLIILSLAIVAAGIIGAIKLNYWQRSVSIFKVNSSEQQFGRGGRGPGMEGFGRGEGMRDGMRRELSDSIRQRFAGQGRPEMRMERQRPDSLFRRVPGQDSFRGEGGLGRGSRIGDRHGEEDFRGGKKINLDTVGWFLAVFASFTVLTIYVDKAYCMVSKRKGRQSLNRISGG